MVKQLGTRLVQQLPRVMAIECGNQRGMRFDAEATGESLIELRIAHTKKLAGRGNDITLQGLEMDATKRRWLHIAPLKK
ncbi:hypothetical protein [Paraburkholderia phenazinium]|uniref:hypothetical protein n=1 Tax=Paraburkholderia phenazinium TaxID=60549 RepID=UPI001180B876|nr:hypothetical protein [Paraburkholderia phenazinium]